jgi:protein phosphatase
VSDSTAALAGVVVVWAAESDRGRVRPVNEDSVLGAPPMFVVADGMGGREAGDRASAAVVAAFAEPERPGGLASLDEVRRALQGAVDGVQQVAAGTRRGAGSTVTGVAMVEHLGTPHWLVFNVGDSRVYRHADGVLEQLTVDHSLGQELVDAGQLARAELRGFRDGNVITRAIGAADSSADSWLLPVTDGERLLLCTDGLHHELADESIRAALTLSGPPASAVATLVRLANLAGGRDNVTALVVDVLSGGRAAGQDGDLTASASAYVTGTDDADTTLEVRR